MILCIYYFWINRNKYKNDFWLKFEDILKSIHEKYFDKYPLV